MKRVATVLLAVCLLLSLGSSLVPAQTPTATAPAASATPGRGAPPAVTAPTGTAPAGTRGAPPTVAPTPIPDATPTATPMASTPTTATAPPPKTAPASDAPCATAQMPTGPTAFALPQKEIVALRNRTSRTYLTDRGMRAALLSPGSVNYQDSKGAWQPIDGSLVAATTSGYAFQNKANRYTLSLPADLGGAPVRIDTGGAFLSFALAGAKGAASTCNETATYANALPGVTVAYSAGADEAKETLTLQDATAPHVFVFNAQLSAGLTAKMNGGGIDVVDGAGTVQFRITPPYMDDHSGKPGGHSTAVTLQLAQAPGGATITLTADAAWLADPARVYPVVIDPTVTFTTGTDCTIVSPANANTSFCGNGTFNFGDDGTNVERGLVGFSDFASQTIPAQSQVLYAEFGLYDVGNSTTNTTAVNISPLTGHTFTSSATWNTYDGTNAWTAPGGDFNTSSTYTYGNSSVGGGTGWSLWYPTRMVQGWVDGTVPYHGLIAKEATENVTNVMTFASSTYPTASERPYMKVLYNPWYGEQRIHTFDRSALSDRMSLDVNPANGMAVLHAHDFTVQGTGLPLIFDRFYDAYSVGTPFTSAFGNNWRSNTENNVNITAFPDGSATLLGPSGYLVPLLPDGSGGYITPTGVDATLTRNGTTGVFALKFHLSGTTFNFNQPGFHTSDVDKNGNTITYTLDGANHVTAITDTQGRTFSLTYITQNGVSLVSTITDANASPTRTWQYGYDATTNDLTSYTDPAGKVTAYTYTSGNLTKITDPRGNLVTLGYDAQSRVTSVVRVTNNGTLTGPTTTYTYNSGTTVATDPNSHATTYTYDTQGRVTSVQDALNHTQAVTYNTDSNVLTHTDAITPTGNVTNYTYGANGGESLTNVQWPASATGVTAASRSATFPTTGLRYLPSTGTDAQGNQLSYAYDTNGNLTQVAGGTVHVDAAYNSDGTLQYTRDAMSPANQTSYSYTPSAHTAGTHFTQIVATPPSPLGTTTVNFDALSRVSSIVDGKGQRTSFTYDSLDRVTRITYNGDTTCASRTTCTDYTYDNNGNLLTRVDATGTTSFTYDKQNHQLTKTLPGAGSASVTYTYDAVGNLATLADAGGTVTYGYDAVNNLTSLAEPGGSCTGTVTKCTTFAYDANNRRTSTVYPTSPVVTIAQTYFPNGALKSIIATKAGTSTTLTSFTYAYANATGGDIALRSSVVDGVAGTTTSYGYDSFNRLTSAAKTGTSYAYGYDNNGNLTTATLNGTSLFSGTPTYNNANQLTALGTTAFTYDSNGNQLTGTLGTLVYNAKNQTTSVTPSGGAAFNLAYAGDGQMQRITAGATSYTNDAIGVGSETTGSTTTSYTRTPGGRLVSERLGGAAYYYLFDGLGSVVGLIDSTGAVKDTYSYDPYGKVTAGGSNSVANPWQYTGGYLDGQTGLVKLGQRFYDPTLGRWTQRDPLGGGYAYASDNPINFVDPSGLFTAKGCAGGAAIGGVAGGVLGGPEGFIGGAVEGCAQSDPAGTADAVYGTLGPDSPVNEANAYTLTTVGNTFGDFLFSPPSLPQPPNDQGQVSENPASIGDYSTPPPQKPFAGGFVPLTPGP